MQNINLHEFQYVVDSFDNEASNQIIEDFEAKLTKPKKSVIVGIEKFVDKED